MKNNFLNWFFAVEVILFSLIITGILPREIALYLGAALVIYFLAAPLDDSLVFFVRSIPLFLALPITAGFDNFNVWRILAAILFLKWLFKNSIKYYVLCIKDWVKNFSYKKPPFLLIILLILAVLSVIPAPDKMAAIKRIIFFLNFAVLGVVICDKAENQEFVKRLIKNSIIPVIIVATVGYIQVISTYFIDIYQFMRIWGEGIQCRQFGEQWCNIAVQLGNTWFAYFGEQLSLRVFSLFPDSHSFPQFVLLGIPAILAMLLRKNTNHKTQITNKTQKIKAQIPRIIILSSLFLIIILSGTRGIWAASVGVILLALAIIFYTNRQMPTKSAIAENVGTFKNLTRYLVIFFVMFAVAFPIFSSPQFLVGKSDDILKNRIKSIIDFGETSNAQRIEIWKKTLSSIKEKPFLGVGIGNYPVVLEQDIRLAKAGSSAHNLYLHITAEMGILAGIIFIWFLWLLFKRNYDIFTKEGDKQLGIYFAATLLFVPWVLIYSLTDIAIFDERSFLMFVTTTALILGTKKPD
ncbi:MAG: hypothetical protein A2651_02330 [Candidatus Yanofskybacteria bacterium RIFCSPHIGHO2_01_FULL_42_12]|uniref:O-antigen ligase-related domain-containing protein n=1 Tax=Candidatus Yanofskybacteria bacterium RIFCSPLOWO2_01_FULL_42_49 TaxID=1802694 RepID=A0A1F8GBY6_9BACT|nr:MAG: hypothetical protein A2651_02330 [Candidatus Yanofskybacteria bacterium RIFCSPHIGHO2_01_FULL_42_12]OGN22791.1 MAG: hypothetical protein A2918_01485 [Candidatus Yanofskybacteria bacterium RIFCSPLOWO2_01_FULL_42_49]